MYHSVKDRPESLEPYALYVIVEKGQLKVVHVFGKNSTSLTVGEGLNRDEWHSVLVRIDVHGAKLIARVDDKQAETSVEVLENIVNYGVSEELASVVLIGGLFFSLFEVYKYEKHVTVVKTSFDFFYEYCEERGKPVFNSLSKIYHSVTACFFLIS